MFVRSPHVSAARTLSLATSFSRHAIHPSLLARAKSLVVVGLLAACLVGRIGSADEPAAPQFDAAAVEFFEKEVRPILANRCYECHSGKAQKVQGNLLVDSRAAILKGGDTGAAIVPGKPKESLLIDSINYGDTYQMPPKSKMPEAEIATLTRWVEMGAPWPAEKPAAVPTTAMLDLAQRRAEHWCWQPIQAPPLPNLKNAAWPRQALDRFILARLEAAGLTPAAEADRRTLLRRLSFDLTGLPPTPAEVEAFVRDESPQAYERRVDELLRSPHFGERWTRHWLDLVRYAETYGHEFDFGIPHAAQYRDYLVRAFNADVPYNQFLLEHVAGDLLQPPRRHPTEGYNESVIGTGFWFLGEATHAPVDARGDEMGRIDNQLDVLSKTFLGVTIACARCHDHKFDAISTRDYYALAGIVKSSRRQEALLDPQGRIAEITQKMASAAKAGDDMVRQTVPRASDKTAETVARYLLAARAVRKAGAEQLVTIAAQQTLDADRLRRWVAALDDAALKQPNHAFEPWLALANQPADPQPADIAAQRQRLENAARQAADARTKSVLLADFNATESNNAPDFRTLGWFTTGEAFGDRPVSAGQWDAASRGLQAARPGVADSGRLSPKAQGVLRSPTFTISHRHLHYRLRGRDIQIRLIIDGYFMDVYSGLLFGGCNMKIDQADTWSWRTQGGDIGRYLGHRAHIEIIDHGDGFAAIDEIRLSDEGAPPDIANPLGQAALAAESNKSLADVAHSYGQLLTTTLQHWTDQKSTADETELINWLLRHGLLADEARQKSSQDAVAAAGRLLDELSPTLPAPLKVLAMTDGTGQMDRVHIRGNYRTLGEPVARRSLEALDGHDFPTDVTGSGRLQLAREWVSPGNPLVSRVMVNRMWHHLFGRGIVPSVDNFGVLGQEPTHPELLDHLATEFMREGWSMKQLIRTIVLSSTYRMSSVSTPAGDAADPQNKLLHHQRIRRLEGEAIRDAVLRISGRLDPTLYGGSVPVHLTPFMQGRGRPGGSGPLDGNGRRSIYTEVRRNFLSPMMLAFDTPIPFSTVGARNTSNVPAQALILMNDPLVVEQATRWAKRVLDTPNLNDDQRVDTMYLEAFSRLPSDNERAAAFEFLNQQANEYRLPTDQARKDPRVWADLGHVLFNVKEFIFVN